CLKVQFGRKDNLFLLPSINPESQSIAKTFVTAWATIGVPKASPQPISRTVSLPESNFEQNLYRDKTKHKCFGSTRYWYEADVPNSTLGLLFSLCKAATSSHTRLALSVNRILLLRSATSSE